MKHESHPSNMSLNVRGTMIIALILNEDQRYLSLIGTMRSE